MNPDDWLDAFPHQPASKATRVLAMAWKEAAKKYKKQLNLATLESRMTLILVTHIRDITSQEQKLLGHWSAEDTKATISARGKILNRTRTDIEFSWNDRRQNLTLIFEFKKLSPKAADRRHYLGPKGMERFVKAIYAKEDRVAVMVGLVSSPAVLSVGPLMTDLNASSSVKTLKLRKQKGGGTGYVQSPAKFFSAHASFYTVHGRIKPGITPKIHIEHMFLEYV